ncbi:MAG: hypothetical protein ABSB19_00305 [Methylomonas sp.]|jgi:hypothetical protein
MRLINLFLLAMLILALPLQGFASIAGLKIPCPAEASGMLSKDTGNKHNCCNDADTVAKTGKLCKTQQNCQPNALVLIDVAQPRIIDTISAKIPPFTNLLSLSFDQAATWRPPNLG